MTRNDKLEALRPQASLPVKSALKDAVGRELASEASAARAKVGRAAVLEHLASPGRCAPAASRAG